MMDAIHHLIVTVLAILVAVTLFHCNPKVVSLVQKLHRGQPDYFRLSGVPPPSPLINFSVDQAKARPYRPFRWEYHQNMALMKMEPDWWIELESTYRERIEQRKQLYAQHGKLIVDTLPGSKPACRELMEMVIQFLCVRYPNQFQYESRSGMFYNQILHSQTDTRTIDALQFLLNHVPEDFLVMQHDKPTGLYVLRAGVACSAVGWNIATKIGKPLHEIHGPVPDYEEKMKMSMDRFFSKMPCHKPIQRGSWTFEIGQPLFDQSDDPDFATRGFQKPDLDEKDIYLRVDWQTLRRLPISQAIVFNYKALFTPVTEFQHEPYIPRLVAKILREGKPKILKYKSTYHIEHRLLPVLDLWAKDQEKKSWVPIDWKERTLDENPYYPGWEGRIREG